MGAVCVGGYPHHYGTGGLGCGHLGNNRNLIAGWMVSEANQTVFAPAGVEICNKISLCPVVSRIFLSSQLDKKYEKNTYIRKVQEKGLCNGCKKTYGHSINCCHNYFIWMYCE